MKEEKKKKKSLTRVEYGPCLKDNLDINDYTLKISPNIQPMITKS